MPSILQPNDEFGALADQHRSWLKLFPPIYLEKWEERLVSDYEAAMSEAHVRRILVDHGANPEPNEDPSIGGPDFRCSADGSRFYVEVTCITIAAAEEKTCVKVGEVG